MFHRKHLSLIMWIVVFRPKKSSSDISEGIPEGFKLPGGGAIVTPGMFGGSSLATPAPIGIH